VDQHVSDRHPEFGQNLFSEIGSTRSFRFQPVCGVLDVVVPESDVLDVVVAGSDVLDVVVAGSDVLDVAVPESTPLALGSWTSGVTRAILL
jgi:hypothetical protein